MHFLEVLVLALVLKLPMIPGGTNLEPLEKIQLGFLKEYHFVNRENIFLFHPTMQIFFATKVRRESQPPQPLQKCYYILWFLWVYSPSSWHTLETNYWLKVFSVVNSHVLNNIENMILYINLLKFL